MRSLKDIKKIITFKPNLYQIPVTTTHDVEEFNSLYKEVLALGIPRKDFVHTKSGGISVKSPNCWAFRYEIMQHKNLGVDILVSSVDGLFRIRFRSTKDAETMEESKNTVSGWDSFRAFKRALNRQGVNIDDFAIENGVEVKKEIPKYRIEIFNERIIDKTLTNVHHLDLNSSFGAGVAEYNPVFRPTIEKWYKLRKLKLNEGTDKEEDIGARYKSMLTNLVGYFQSVSSCKARFAHISKYAITRNNEKLDAMISYLRSTGRIPLATNTDGIWFAGEPTNIHETHIGGWKEDHVNCTIRFKSKGCYEYLEKGEYTPVVRGYTKLDSIKPRKQWAWGDIYQDNAICMLKYKFVENIGIVEEYVNEELEQIISKLR